jgi:hypothetical protein
MALNIFPSSPLPAGLDRDKDWGENITKYDSGARQGLTPFQRPLHRWSVPWKNINEIKQAAISSFIDLQKGMVTPFLMKDPDTFRVNSVLAVATNQLTNPVSLNLFDTRSYFIRADTTTIGSFTSALSGFVVLGTDYDYDQDTGLLTVHSINSGDYWTVQSAQFFHKCAFAAKYKEKMIIWNQFSMRLEIEEIV